MGWRPHDLVHDPSGRRGIVVRSEEGGVVIPQGPFGAGGVQSGDELIDDVFAIACGQQDGIDQDGGAYLLGVSRGEFERDEATETVADHRRALDPELGAGPGDVVGEGRDRVAAARAHRCHRGRGGRPRARGEPARSKAPARTRSRDGRPGRG